MEPSVKCFYVLGFLVIVCISGFVCVDGAGPCGRNSPDEEALNLIPCVKAGQDEKAAVPDSCCLQVKKMGQNPSCLCAVLLSDTVGNAGIKREVAITIPKRCNIADRPVGYKCGPYTLP